VAAEASPRRPAGTALWEPPRPLDELMPPPPPPRSPADDTVPPERSFAAGFRAAVKTHLALNPGDLIEGAGRRYRFDAETRGSTRGRVVGPLARGAERGPRMKPFKEPSIKKYVDALALRLRAEATPEAHFAADQLERASQLIRFTGAQDAAQFAARVEANELWEREKEYRRGFDAGRIKGIEECQLVIRASYGHHN